MQNDQNKQPQQGSGSAENTGRSREEQLNPNLDLGKGQRKEIAEEGGLGRERMTDIKEMGGLSGRDDYAGGDSEGMSDQSTGQKTDQ